MAAYCPEINFPAELVLCLNFVAFGDSYISHIVAKAHDLEVFGEIDADADFLKLCQSCDHILFFPVSGDHFSGLSESCADKAVLSVTMGCLIEIHEVHIDLFIRNFLIVLSCQMAPGLLQQGKSRQPHLGRREGMAPCHHAKALVIIIGLLDHLCDLP